MRALALAVLAASAAPEPDAFEAYARQISPAPFASLPFLNEGRRVPGDTLARETLLFLSGSSRPRGLEPVPCYLAYITFPANAEVELIDVRNAEVREQLGFPGNSRLFSLRQLDQAGIVALGGALAAREPQSLNAFERGTLEAFRQYTLAREVASGDHLLRSLNPSSKAAVRSYLLALRGEPGMAESAGQQFASAARAPLDSSARDALDLEVRYNWARPFLWASILFLCIGLLALMPASRRLPLRALTALSAVPTATVVGGLIVRGRLAGVIPATTPYEMVTWWALGLALLSGALLERYRSRALFGVGTLATGVFFALAQLFPLALNPAIDAPAPLLRSNFWLALHVGATAGGFAALTGAMLIANFALTRLVASTPREHFQARMAHRAWRCAQVGACLLTAGMVFGGIWADGAWGRAWTWEPKETWALLADVAFLVLLYTRHRGRLSDLGLLLGIPAAYLVLAIAWYGVNALMRAGLHSFGFFSAGWLPAVAFAASQLVVLLAAGVSGGSNRLARTGSTKADVNKSPAHP
jgi:ABC-type transport system involved in cytochrome c biogenesis permease subunit